MKNKYKNSLHYQKRKRGKLMNKDNKKIELLKPRYDVVFQALFQGNNENITESLISDILGEKVEITTT